MSETRAIFTGWGAGMCTMAAIVHFGAGRIDYGLLSALLAVVCIIGGELYKLAVRPW